jgi:hypothetical protein
MSFNFFITDFFLFYVPKKFWVYNGRTMGVQWAYNGRTMGVQWAYNGRTNELFTSEYLSEAPKGLKYHNLIINIGVLFYHTHLITPHRAL